MTSNPNLASLARGISESETLWAATICPRRAKFHRTQRAQKGIGICRGNLLWLPFRFGFNCARCVSLLIHFTNYYERRTCSTTRAESQGCGD